MSSAKSALIDFTRSFVSSVGIEAISSLGNHPSREGRKDCLLAVAPGLLLPDDSEQAGALAYPKGKQRRGNIPRG